MIGSEDSICSNLECTEWDAKPYYIICFSVILSARHAVFFLQCYFACMFNSLIGVLISSGLGCHVDGIRVGFMMCTDNWLLMSESLQLMIDVCCSDI